MGFTFKKFHVNQDKTAMKVGIDSVILGAWSNGDSNSSILDIGTGTGILALMMAQRFEHAAITAIELNQDAYNQAQDNVSESNYANKLTVIKANIIQFAELSEEQYDFIICNPPYFNGSFKPEDEGRNTARHEKDLNTDSLLCCVQKLLKDSGVFSVIYPFNKIGEVLSLAERYNLSARRILKIFPTEKKACNRVCLELVKGDVNYTVKKLLIRSGGAYTQQFRELTREFYLNLK